MTLNHIGGVNENGRYGSSSKVDSTIVVTESCKNIAYLNQYYTYHNGNLVILSPDKLYDIYF